MQGRGGQPHELREPPFRKQFNKQPILSSTSQNCGSHNDHCLRKHSRRFVIFTGLLRQPHRGHCRYRVFNCEIEGGTAEDALQSFTWNTISVAALDSYGEISVKCHFPSLDFSTIGSRFTTGLRSRIFCCKSIRHKTSTV
jgi:hypothetical protein